MKRSVDAEMISRIVILLLIGFIFFYVIFMMTRFDEGQSGRQTVGVEAIINKALVQCYALEGRYPSSLEYVQKYGVILNNDAYLYHYEWYGDNIRPIIMVIEK